MQHAEIISQLRDSIRQTAPGAKVILYGSYARGDAREDSDIDLLIIVDDEQLTPEKEQSIVFPLFDVEFASGITVSPLVVSRKKWENRPFKTPFYINVVNEGIEL
ncbi:MAG TPA: nucleotidyltransferase domain-containing protein [Petrimonas sp.]|uniref:nucleotidyltransferase domain-containing protein n=1 Tax=Petrimonas sp. TaxID=2023866 RepID=UPI00095A9552|nr:nucleotidyltransferase domain-containing protein [Petrimonas sp.]OJV37064.1 MAG: hypothetical protein BGO33_10820 [Bacteroidia bacterium 43-41]MEA4948206.1 nucleotidyltransferase domain-containing protein [Petrimonas sp.]MEA4979308.1 nucleotidyltransferase domain-containing protein [Petrimonas sp.]MEA5044770.1 nucleotidyltransferase domain-containing protein [Petrimonas sp.]